MGNVLLLGGDTDFNLGDRAVLRAVCAALNAADRRLAIAATGSRALPPASAHISTVVPRGPTGLAALFRAGRAADLIGIAGGGLFQDDDSRIKMPYWASRLAALRSLGRPIVAHALGAGPLRHPESRLAARLACAQLRDISVRDRFALAALEPCTDRSVAVTPDPAFMLDPAPPEAALDRLRDAGLPPDRPLIGVVVRRWFHPRGGFIPHKARVSLGLDQDQGQARLSSLLDSLATVLRGAARELDAAVLLLPSYSAAHEGDVAAAKRLQARLGDVDSRLLALEDPSVYKAVVGRLQLLVSARMHPLIFAAGMGVPFVGLAYNPKFNGLYDMLGMTARGLPLDDLGTPGAADLLARLVREALADRTPLAARSAVLAARARDATVAALHPDRPPMEVAA